MADEKLDAEIEAAVIEYAGCRDGAACPDPHTRIRDLARKVRAIERERCLAIADDPRTGAWRTDVAAAIREARP